MKYIIVLGVFICCAKQIYSDNPKVAAVKNFKVITGPEVYDKDIRPNLGENASVQVNITMHVTDYEFNPITREMTMVMYFRQKWTDPRLVSNTLTADVIGGKSIIERVWTPDTFFSNSLDVNIMKYPTRNLFAKVLHNGEVYYSERIKVVFRCGPQISIKSDECDLEIESYGSSMADIDYSWSRKGSIGISSPINNNKYKLTYVHQLKKVEVLSTGNYSRLLANFKLDCTDCMDNDIVDTTPLSL